MSLDSVLGTAASGLASVNRHLGLVSQNVANAGTAGYAREVADDTNLTSGGVGYGVRAGIATRETDAALQSALNGQNADVAGQQVISSALSAVDAAQGTVAAGNDLASRVGVLANAFTGLAADPANGAQQAAVVSAADTLAGGIRQQAAAYAAARQGAQDGLVGDVAALNTAMHAIGTLSDKIINATALGQSTADLETQRTAREQTAAQLGGLQFLPALNGDVTAVSGGLVINTRALSGPFAVAAATLGSGSAAPPVTLSGSDVTQQLTAGSIGARITLRDTTLPQAQAGLDEFAKTLSTRLSAQGLQLFTDGSGNPPVIIGAPVQSGYIGFSNTIQANPAVRATPRLVRDGTQAVAAGFGGASAFTPNAAGGPAGFGTLIGRVLQYGFGAQAQAGVPQPAPAAAGLGASGGIALPYQTGTSLQSFAASLAGAQAQTAGVAKDALATGQALQTSLQSKLSSETGVSVDTELSNLEVLQNAYGANAKVITAVQSLWTSLLDAVRP